MYQFVPVLCYIYIAVKRTVIVITAAIIAVFSAQALCQEGVIVSPDPFDPGRGSAMISYVLEKDTDVFVYIFGPGGRLLAKKEYRAGQTGGSAGFNQVEWSGKSEYGDTARRGTHLVRIMESDTQKVIGGAKLLVAEGYALKGAELLGALAAALLVMTGLLAAGRSLPLKRFSSVCYNGLAAKLKRMKGDHDGG